MGLYEDILAQIAASQPAATTPATSGGAAETATTQPAVSYVPGTDVPKEPGFDNPTNPYDTGRAGEKNEGEARAAGYAAESVPGWDYDARAWRSGYGPDNMGFGDPALGGGGGGGSVSAPLMQETNAAGEHAWNPAQGPPPALQRNPTLPQHPLGAFSDARYEAETAMLRADIARAYNDILSQLGYSDEKGGFVKGTVEIEADRKSRDLQRGSQLAGEEVTKKSQREGTLFSGVRGTETARAQHPFVQGIADLEVDTPRMLAALYGKAMSTVDEYTRRQNLLIAEAAERAAQRAMLGSRSGRTNTGGSSGTAAPSPTQYADPTFGNPNLGSAESMLAWGTAAGYEWDPNTGTWVPQPSEGIQQRPGGPRF